MGFTLLPAVDVADGRAVRLAQGDASSETRHGGALDAAMAWQADGAEWVHLVDLDAAFGRGSNADLLTSVIARLDVKVQLSGGIVDDGSLARALSTGCARVVLGTAALDDPAWCARALDVHGDRVAVSLDVRVEGAQHRLAARGSTHDVGDLWETITRLDREGCGRYIVTDVSKDGMLSGPNLDLYRTVAMATDAQVIASGGVAEIDDLLGLAELSASATNLEGAVVGKALYAGRFTLADALKTVRQGTL